MSREQLFRKKTTHVQRDSNSKTGSTTNMALLKGLQIPGTLEIYKRCFPPEWNFCFFKAVLSLPPKNFLTSLGEPHYV